MAFIWSKENSHPPIAPITGFLWRLGDFSWKFALVVACPILMVTIGVVFFEVGASSASEEHPELPASGNTACSALSNGPSRNSLSARLDQPKHSSVSERNNYTR
jgi:hypothetical protein